jgi:hypothetical protein
MTRAPQNDEVALLEAGEIGATPAGDAVRVLR